MSASETIERQVDDVAAKIAKARRSLGDGLAVDLSAFEAKVRALADAVRRQPPADALGFEARVRAILDELDHLGREVAAAKETVDEKLADMELTTTLSLNAWKAG